MPTLAESRDSPPTSLLLTRSPLAPRLIEEMKMPLGGDGQLMRKEENRTYRR